MGCHKKEKPTYSPSYPVQITNAVSKPTDVFLEALGHIESITSVQIRSRIEGELTGIFFKQGDEVKKGDLLFTIDPKPYLAKVKEAKGALSETLANLSLAEEKVKRYRTLARDEYYSQIDYETLQSNMASLKGQAEQIEGALDAAQINLEYCWIYAPINGKVGILQIDYGNLIKADDENPLVTLNQMAPIYVTLSIPEFQLHLVRKSQKFGNLQVLGSFEDFGPDSFKGDLYMIDNEVSQETGMIKIRAIFENEERSFWPGQFIRTRLILEHLEDSIVIPFTALQLTPSGPVVFVMKDDMTVEERKVTLGQRNGPDVVIKEGVKAGEKVVMEGQINLSNGAKVFIPTGKGISP